MKQIPLLFVLSFAGMLSCDSDEPRTVNCAKSNLSIVLEHTASASTCVSSDGSALVTVSGGKEPYTFTINGSAAEGPAFQGLSPGIYTIIVRDKNKCERVLENVTVLSEGFSFETNIINDTECLGANGSVTINVVEGVPPYQYRRGAGAFTDENTFTSLDKGSHDFELKDGNGCVVSLRVTVPQGFTATSFNDDVLPIIKTSCAISGCHNGIDRADLRKHANAQKYAAEIKSLTRKREMPFEGSITQDQIDIFSCWVDDGALNN